MKHTKRIFILACVLMLLNYMGEDVYNKYTEHELLKMYEEVNGTTVYSKGTTEAGLINLIESLDLGYTATNEAPAYPDGFTKTNFIGKYDTTSF